MNYFKNLRKFKCAYCGRIFKSFYSYQRVDSEKPFCRHGDCWYQYNKENNLTIKLGKVNNKFNVPMKIKWKRAEAREGEKRLTK